MRGPWYVSASTASTALAAVVALAALPFACGTGASRGSAQPVAVGLLSGPAPAVGAASTVTLAGARCTAGSCKCREPGKDDAETDAPGPGSKRFEIRISAAGGTASLDLSELGTVATGAAAPAPAPADVEASVKETCAYVDIPAGSTHQARFVALESAKGQGVAPRLSIAEYGAKGPYWYDIVSVSCEGPNGRCDRDAADAWSRGAQGRKRGRVEPCGSAVVTKLAWESSGGQAARDGGLFRDFSTRFTMEVKKFATQFAPGSTECVPK